MIRSKVALDTKNTRCVIIGSDGTVLERLRAYELTAAKKIGGWDIRHNELRSDPVRLLEIGIRVRSLLDGPCCYAFYCAATRQVKIGETTKLLRRWTKLEMEGGRPLQLIAFWPSPDNRRLLEKRLHAQFSDHRGLGEWFVAEPVLTYLRSKVAC